MTNKTIMSWYRSLLIIALLIFGVFFIISFIGDSHNQIESIVSMFLFFFAFPFGFLIIARIYNLLAYGKWVVEE